VILGVTSSTWTQILVALSIFVPLIITVALTVFVLRGKKNDPDEQRWRRLKDAGRSE
jgi:hypothetical protein